MSQISATVRLRPIRFAFLVRPNDGKRLLEIFQTNTCLWGGRFNPVIPVFRQIPTWWDRNGHRFETAKQILNGYLDTFEPDFLVESEKGLAAGLGFSSERVLQLRAVLPDDKDTEGTGLSTLGLYEELYRKEFQFARRHKHNIKIVTPEDKRFDAFCACLFGAFPKRNSMRHFKDVFSEAFEPAEVTLNGSTLKTLYESGLTAPLRMGSTDINVDYNSSSSTSLFVLNALEPRDLIDYWNLRTLQRDIIPVPIQWADHLTGYCKSLITKAYRPMPRNSHGVMLRATVMFARSIPKEDIEGLHKKYFSVDVPGANLLQDFYPPIWRRASSMQVRSSRPTLTAAEKTFDVQFLDDKRNVRFDSLHPTFAERFSNTNYRWANVVKIKAWNTGDQIATALPTDYKNPKVSPFAIVGDPFLPTTEGYVVFPNHREMPHYWRLADGVGAMTDWLKSCNVNARLSDAGRSTQQIIQTLGGFHGVRSIANEQVVKLLNEISRRPLTKSMRQQEFLNKVSAAIKGNPWRERAAETLVKKSAVELGLELKCEKCSSWSWYSLKQLDYNVNCSLCLRDFSFPVMHPSGNDSARWAYRLIGPFALPNFANGGYAAALAIRFFSQVVSHGHCDITWSSGQELTFSSGKKVEADFILWFQRMRLFGTNERTQIVFGEAKSFGRDVPSTSDGGLASKDDVFLDSDVSRMKLLAEAFPGAILVFATMKPSGDLTVNERRRLRKLAEWGREYVRESRRTRAPVIVLTGTELFASHSLSSTWDKIGGRHKSLSAPGYVHLDSLNVLADLTQQLYLDMPSYHEWAEAKWKARRKRAKAKTTH